MTMKRFLKDFKLEIEIFLFIISFILFIIGITGVFFQDSSPVFLQDIHKDIGGWVNWCAFAGVILLFVSGWYMIDNIRKRREFKKLINTDSKAKFIKNKERIEYLAWVLTTDHEKELWKKKQEFGIKT